MKRAFILSVLLIQFQFLLAQTQTLQVVYLAKDYTTEVTPLTTEIKDMYNAALKDNSQAMVFYLPNATSPYIVRVNLPGENREDMDKVFYSLMTKTETIIDPATDLRSLVGIFDDIPLLDSNGNPAFLNVEMVYYVTPTFWELRYNEQVIASTYFALDFDGSWADGYCSMSIYHCESDGLTVDEEKPFGRRNLCGNYKFYLLTY